MDEAKRDAILEAIELYFDGMYHDDVDKLRRAFHPQAEFVGVFQGHFSWIGLEDFLRLFGRSRSPAQRGDANNNRVVSIDVTGQVAVAKVEDEYLGLRFTDYLTLHQGEQGWQIVHKAYHHHR